MRGFDVLIIGAGSAGCVLAGVTARTPFERMLARVMGGPNDFFMGARPTAAPALRLELAAEGGGGTSSFARAERKGVEARGVEEAVLVDEAAERHGWSGVLLVGKFD
jgi:hypothetical protein